MRPIFLRSRAARVQAQVNLRSRPRVFPRPPPPNTSDLAHSARDSEGRQDLSSGGAKHSPRREKSQRLFLPCRGRADVWWAPASVHLGRSSAEEWLDSSRAREARVPALVFTPLA